MSTLVIIAAAFLGGLRRSRYDGIPPVIWWREQRMHRRPAHIVGRLAKVVAGVSTLVAAFTVGTLLLGVLAVAALLGALLFAAWWYLRAAARACVPHTYRVERFDIEQPPVEDEWPAAPPRPALATSHDNDDHTMEV